MTTARFKLRRRLAFGAAWVAMLSLAAACSSSSSGGSGGGSASGGTPPSGSGSSATQGGGSGGKTVHLTISYSEKVGDEVPLWIAKDGGYFQKNGLDVTLKYLKSNAGIPALLSGQTQIASIGGSDALSAAAQGADLSYVATLAPVYTYTFWAQPKYASVSKLKGQRVGVTSTSGSLYAGTVVILKNLGLSTSDVQIVPLGSVPNVDSALLSGTIAAAASHPPGTYKYKQQKLVKLADLAKQQVPNANTGLAVTTKYATSHSDVVQRVVTSVVQGVQRMKSDKAFAEKMMKKYMDVTDPAIADFTYSFYNNEVIKSVPLPQVDQFQATQKALGASNAKIKSFDLSKLIDQSYVKKAAATLGIK